MTATYLLRNKTDFFYSELSAQPSDLARWHYLQKAVRDDIAELRIGLNNAFRDRVELNQIVRKDPTPKSYELLTRRGYRLARFEF